MLIAQNQRRRRVAKASRMKRKWFEFREPPQCSLFQLGDLKRQLLNRCLQNDCAGIDLKLVWNACTMRLRKPAICVHAMAECGFLNSAGSCLATSPIISRLRTTASIVFSSAGKRGFIQSSGVTLNLFNGDADVVE